VPSASQLHIFMSALHNYFVAGLWVAALYLWQIALLRPHFFNRAATWGGLYVISSSAPAATTVFQLIHLTSLVVLFGALSCYGRSTGGRVSTREFSRHMRPQRTAAGQRSRSEVSTCHPSVIWHMAVSQSVGQSVMQPPTLSSHCLHVTCSPRHRHATW
jgi:hypothetical protein